MANESTRVADWERRQKRSKAKRKCLATEQAMRDEAQLVKIQQLQRKLEELEKERAAAPAASGDGAALVKGEAARTGVAP